MREAFTFAQSTIELSAWPTLVAAALGTCWALVVAYILYMQRREVLPTSTPDGNARAAAAEKLWETYPAFPDDEPDTALFLLEESRREYDGWLESNSRIEAKATWLTGFLAGGAGLLTVFGSGHSDKADIQPGPLLYLAIAAAFCALMSCLYIVRPKLRLHPSASAYVSPATAYASKARFHLALSLAEEYNLASVDLARRRLFDPVAWSTAQGSTIIAVLAILIHFGLNVATRPNETAVVNCRVQMGPLRSGSAMKLACEEPQRVR